MADIPRLDITLSSVPTPIEQLASLSERYDSDLYVKRDDRTSGIAQGNKVRKLEYFLDDALEQGADTVITCGGLQPNHCRATAITARRLGLHLYLLLRGDEPDVYDGNLYWTTLPELRWSIFHRRRTTTAVRKSSRRSPALSNREDGHRT